MIEGHSPGEFRLAKRLLFESPKLLHQLLEVLSDSVTAYLNAQVDAGAQVLMLFDTWGGALSTKDYLEFSLRHMTKAIAGVKRKAEGRPVPIIFFTKGGGMWLEQMSCSGCDALGVDWTVDLKQARATIGKRVALQGNLDPCVLYAGPQTIRREVADVLARFGPGTGHVFNLGHGIHPQIEPEHVAVLVDAVHELSTPYHVTLTTT